MKEGGVRTRLQKEAEMDAQAKMKHYILDKILKDTIEELRESGIGDRDLFLVVKDRPDPQDGSGFRAVAEGAGEEGRH